MANGSAGRAVVVGVMLLDIVWLIIIRDLYLKRIVIVLETF
jgi:hypothetical protein